jgi:hypothetical protein
MLVVVHKADPWAEPDAVFWVEDGELREFTTSTDLGGARRILRANHQQPWEAFFQSLSDRTPHPHAWAAMETDDPVKLLRDLQELHRAL